MQAVYLPVLGFLCGVFSLIVCYKLYMYGFSSFLIFDLHSTWLMLRVEEGKQKLSKIAFVCSVSYKICPTRPALQIKDSGGKEGICIGGYFRDSTSNNLLVLSSTLRALTIQTNDT